MIQNNFNVSLIKTTKVDINQSSSELPPHLGAFKEFKVSEYYCPEEWSKDGIFIQVEENQPMWFDFRNNWDCAVMCSIQKVNPVTGERIDIEKGLIKDPKQNYLRLPEQRWLDGYVNDGKVYQFVITKSGLKISVNEYVLPEYDQDSHAIAFAFFNAKKPKEKNSGVSGYLRTIKADYPPIKNDIKSTHYYDSNKISTNPNWFSPLHSPQNWNISTTRRQQNMLTVGNIDNIMQDSCGCESLESDEAELACSADFSSADFSFDDSIDFDDSIEQIKEEKVFEKASMAAGGRIKQPIVQDDNTVDYYEEKPSAILKVYFAFSEQFNHIMGKGKIQNPEKKDKFIKTGKIGDSLIPLV